MNRQTFIEYFHFADRAPLVFTVFKIFLSFFMLLKKRRYFALLDFFYFSIGAPVLKPCCRNIFNNLLMLL